MASSDEIQPVLDYSARDFDAIRALLVGLAKGIFPEWKTVGEANDFGTLLLELYAYMGDVTNYYIDRIGSEAFLGTAQRRQSILYIAEMLGYRPIGQHAAITQLKFSLSPTYLANEQDPLLRIVDIPAKTVVSTVDETSTSTIYFETDYGVSVAPGSEVTVTATEGRSASVLLGSSRGAPSMSFTLPDKGVVDGSVSIQTREGSYLIDNAASDSPHFVTWNEVGAVASAVPTQSAFSTYLDDKGYTNVLFGDSAAGRIPPVGAEITATYRYGSGATANALAENTIINITNGNLPTDALQVSNISQPVGGSDPESVSSMRNNIPKGTQIRGRAVTIDDYQSLALQVPGVAKAVAYGQIYSAVNVRVAPVGGVLDEVLMLELLGDVQEYLSDKVLLGSKVYVEAAQYRDIYVSLDLYVLDGFNQAQTESDVQQAIQNLLEFDNLEMGQDITIGSIYRRAMRVDGVDYIDLTGLNTLSSTSTVVENVDIPFGYIARIHPAGTDPEADPYGLTINSSGGIE